MKRIVFVFFFALFAFAASAQQTKYVYCELVGTQRLMSTKLTVSIDYGQQKKLFEDNRIKDESGQVKLFNSMVDALNYMGSQGWEFVQAYTVTVGQQNVYHWLLRKEIKDAEPAENEETEQ